MMRPAFTLGTSFWTPVLTQWAEGAGSASDTQVRTRGQPNAVMNGRLCSNGGNSHAVVPPDRCRAAPSGAVFFSSIVLFARTTFPEVTCRPPPRTLAELRAMRVATNATSVRLPVTASAPPFAAELFTRALLPMYSLPPDAATIAPAKLASKRLLRMVELPPFAWSARVPWTPRTVQLCMARSPLSTTTAATPKEEEPPWKATPWISSCLLRTIAAGIASSLSCLRALAKGRRITAPSSPTMLTSLARTKSSKFIGSESSCTPVDSSNRTVVPAVVLLRTMSMALFRPIPPSPTWMVC